MKKISVFLLLLVLQTSLFAKPQLPGIYPINKLTLESELPKPFGNTKVTIYLEYGESRFINPIIKSLKIQSENSTILVTKKELGKIVLTDFNNVRFGTYSDDNTHFLVGIKFFDENKNTRKMLIFIKADSKYFIKSF